ncbi:sensor histidine kinase [Actinomycetospora chiangmaiensis]|uniref:sensor histidine kinase n=1 Tax=Actinomycetospora chiangmaiensis TaxID=402650 RepID=UPI000377D06A|nr:HAMP domain-containing sensor histidine kinase [Actinomycetospora chiangmaiensis]
MRRDRPTAVPARSLRFRVTATVVAVMVVTLLVAGIVVDLVLSAALERDQQSRLTERAQRVDQLVVQQVPADEMVALLDGQGVRAVRVAAGGAVLQGVPQPPTPPGGGPPGPAGRPPGPRPVHAGQALIVTKTLPDGTAIVLSADPGEVDAVVYRLRGVMVGVGVVGVVGSALLLFSGVTAALRPLDGMTRVARAITTGDRGQRLRPANTGTEIGRTAAAFDEMLDALDAAQGRSDEAARRERGAAEEARRSEATTRRFLSDAAHELRTPLAGMQTLAETLVRDSDEDREVREELAIALVRETSRASALVSDMLDLARIEGGQELDREEVDLARLAREQVDHVRLVSPALDLQIETDGPVVAAIDAQKVRRVLVNLLDNARRHVGADGVISVGVSADRDVGDGGEPRGRIVVHNDGEVIAEEDRDRVFDRLVRLDEARAGDAGGAGLGLSIARALVRAHGGDLVYRAVPGGSDFVVTLPLATSGAAAAGPVAHR